MTLLCKFFTNNKLNETNVLIMYDRKYEGYPQLQTNLLGDNQLILLELGFLLCLLAQHCQKIITVKEHKKQ